MSTSTNLQTGHSGQTTSFLTDSTLCIGCKACEVACKEWNGVSADGFDWSGFSYDNTGAVGHSTWRHVKFVEGDPQAGFGGNSGEAISWEFSSDVCKHCEVAGCLEACPTGAITRMEFGAVYVQPETSAMAAHIVLWLALSAWCRRTVRTDARSSAPSVLIDSELGWNLLAQRRVLRSRSNLERSISSAAKHRSAYRN